MVGGMDEVSSCRHLIKLVSLVDVAVVSVPSPDLRDFPMTGRIHGCPRVNPDGRRNQISMTWHRSDKNAKFRSDALMSLVAPQAPTGPGCVVSPASWRHTPQMLA